MNLEKYFIERFDGGDCNFNLWRSEEALYDNVATLFYKDKICMIEISQDNAEKVLAMKSSSPEEVADFIDFLISNGDKK